MNNPKKYLRQSVKDSQGTEDPQMLSSYDHLRELDFVQIYLSTRKIIQFLSFVVLGLLLASTTGQFYRHFINRYHLRQLVRLFYIDAENNIPSTYSSLTLILCSVLLAVIAIAKNKQKDPYVRYWIGLSLIFLYLSIDEAASIHEIFINRLRSILNVGGIFYYAWVIPAAILVLIFIGVYLRFLFSLPTKTRVLFMIAGITFISGALGTELIGGWYYDTYRSKDIIYVAIVTVEEALEMLGIILFIYALLNYMSTYVKFVGVFIDNKRT